MTIFAVIGKKLQFFEERITSCQLLHHMLQDNRDTNKCLRVTSRAHLQSQMLLAQDTFQVTKVEPRQATNPSQHHQLQQHMSMFEETARLARQELFRMSSLALEFA